MDSIPYFRILSISYFFLGTFRIFSTNILGIFRKTTFNLFVAILTGIANIVLDFVLITHYSAYGAAWATLVVLILASVLSFPYLLKEVFVNSKSGTKFRNWRK